MHYSVWSLASNTTVSNWSQSQGRPTKSIVKSETVSTRRNEEDSKVSSIPWVDVHHNPPSKCYRSKTGHQLPTKVNIRSILLGRSEHNYRWDSLSKMVRYKATRSRVQPRRGSQLLSESLWVVPLPSVVLHHWSRNSLPKLLGPLLRPYKGSRLLIGQWSETWREQQLHSRFHSDGKPTFLVHNLHRFHDLLRA